MPRPRAPTTPATAPFPAAGQAPEHPSARLRHAGYVLRIEPLSSSSSANDRQDVPFRVSS
ncbi:MULTISPECIES: fascin domain-containing protein [Micromonospora]|uniref:Uncharacterized protein n=1 Tax=Micromonospora gifhornensis TaxID=84594 RepID=A0ABQ4IBR0_9ACTN|nr:MULTISPECIES: hypothetical protein [Micromonospora]PMR58384.1 hypothetical protein C1A38_24980 [Verrucosispora sp. ts21]GIJ15322.1 hypothetical protein Vgi01_20060 [Micromonospora gifhornensis]